MIREALASIAALLSGVLLLPLLLVALALRGFRWMVDRVARWIEPAFVPWTELIQFDPVLGWKPRPNLETHYLAENDDVFGVVTDEEGWPARSSITSSKAVAVGDSFVFGYGVDSRKSFTQVDPSFPIKGIGAPGYSMVQGVLLMEQYAERLKGKTVIWVIFTENDLADNHMPNLRHYRGPFLRRNGQTKAWEIARDHISAEPWECSQFRRRHPIFRQLHAANPISDRAYSACQDLLTRAARICQAAGAHLAVMTAPHPVQVDPGKWERMRRASGIKQELDADYPDRRIGEMCRQLNVPFLAGKEFLTPEDYKPHEGIHWTEQGHRRVAEYLKRFCISLAGRGQNAEVELRDCA